MTTTSTHMATAAGQEKTKPNHVIFADFDNTQLLTKDQKAIPDHSNHRSALMLTNLVNNGHLNLVHCTGRVFDQINRDIESGKFSNLPFPVAAKAKTIISGVGTEIHTLDDNNEYVLDQEWTSLLEKNGFEEEIEKFTVPSNGRIMSDFCSLIEAILGENIDLKPQEDNKSTRFKRSLWGTPRANISEVTLKNALVEGFKELGVDLDKIELTISVQTSKIAIDLTPKGVNKEEACKFIIKKQGFQAKQSYMAGDSGNDSHCIKIPDVRIILPANSQESFVQSVKEAHPDSNIVHSEFKAGEAVIETALANALITQKQYDEARNYANITQSNFQHDLYVADDGQKCNPVI